MTDDINRRWHTRFTATTHIYQFRVESHLNPTWATWFDELTLSHEPNGTTCLTGAVEDQETLHGILIKIRDLGLTLISVQRLEDDGQADAAQIAGKTQ